MNIWVAFIVFMKYTFVKHLVSLLHFLILNIGASSQHGNPYVVNYVPDLINVDHQNRAIVQGSDGVV